MTTKLTPLMQQYWDVKSAHEDKIILFRMGDFFEMFHRDAEIAAPILGIALTSRNKKAADETPMCGVPHHSIAPSINKLLQNGFKVAICDQIEDPKFAKGLVKRAVTRILSPGVVYDPDTLDAQKANYIASFDERSLSFLDSTTGEAFYFLVSDRSRRDRLLLNLRPVELVLANTDDAFLKGEGWDPLVSTHAKLADGPQQWPQSAKRLLSYACHLQGEQILQTIRPFELREIQDRLELPSTVIRHLEVFETYKGEARGSLFNAVNRCKTSPGARLLKQWLQFPLMSAPSIERRLDAIESWVKRSEDLKKLRAVLAGVGDLQRRLGKLGNPNCNPRDLQCLAENLRKGLEASALAPDLGGQREWFDAAHEVAAEIERTIVDEPPVQLKNGGIIRRGLTPELDELIELSTNSQQLILDLETRERESTGIPSLKIRYNNVFGYSIEITNTHKDKVPRDRYERRQTLANAERYLTRELEELESKVLSAQSKRIELETKLFENLIKRCLGESQKLLSLAGLWAELDVISSFAWLALEQNYARPQFGSKVLKLQGSRHPVVEQAMDIPFVANDLEITEGGCLLLTGPNMAGKSTLMRQVAITVILAQVGSFVPARSAELPIYDRLFTRIGSSDFLAEGLSTFMVEMKETAEMLNRATENSLVILDEVGRGTSTYDGMSIAQAILEYLLENRRSMTLFATHYHELTELAESYLQLCNAHMSIHEKDGEITFLHQLVHGPANKSYGIHVAKLAGLPATVTRRAGALLKNLEGDRKAVTPQMSMLGFLDRGDEPQEIVEPTKSEEPHPLLVELKTLEVGHLTPLEALNRIAQWQRSLS